MNRGILAFILLFGTQQAWAWGQIGHGAVGEIAERNLTTKGRNFVRSILGTEPLAISGVWPDQVRSAQDRYQSFSPYHYLKVPYQYKSYEHVPLSQRANKDAHTIIANAESVLTSPDYSREQKMVYLRFLVHVVGDVHQPLHVGHGLDRGGNLCDVKWKDVLAGNIIREYNLHKVWDEDLFDVVEAQFRKDNGDSKGKRWFGYQEFTKIVLDEFEGKKKTSVQYGTPSQWYNESRELHKVAYPDGYKTDPAMRNYCKTIDPETGKVINGSYDPKKVKLLSKSFINTAVPVVKERIYVAGIRLGKLINNIARKANVPQMPSDSEILDGILLENSVPDLRTPASLSVQHMMCDH